MADSVGFSRRTKSGASVAQGKIKASSIQAINKDQLSFLLGNKEREFNDAMNKALGLAMEVLVDPPPSLRRTRRRIWPGRARRSM
ncbi:MAG: hypothetical protein U0Y68_14165 [Blastocatellia bacterium]